MAVLGLSVVGGAIRSIDRPDQPLSVALGRALRSLPRGQPVSILVHGYKFSPERVRKNPHQLIFAPRTQHSNPKYMSWPEGLGFHSPLDGLCIGFGWPASDLDHPGPGINGFHRVYRAAPQAGRHLADLIEAVRAAAPDCEVDLFTHSLGARVVLSALPWVDDNAVGRVILMGAAEFDRPAAEFLAANHTARVFNITSRDNRLYDALLTRFGPTSGRHMHPLGRGIAHLARNAVDIRLDDPGHLKLLKRRGVTLPRQSPKICHWSFYTRPGAFKLYAEILRNPHNWTLPELRAEVYDLSSPGFRLRLPGQTPPSGAGGVAARPLTGR
ncbi:MAG: hypothetical protein AAGA19_04550 [Pseudomonadota bacterium]